MEAFTSTPVYKDNRLYSTIKRGELVCLDADSGEEVWVLKLAPDQDMHLHYGLMENYMFLCLMARFRLWKTRDEEKF